MEEVRSLKRKLWMIGLLMVLMMSAALAEPEIVPDDVDWEFIIEDDGKIVLDTDDVEIEPSGIGGPEETSEIGGLDVDGQAEKTARDDLIDRIIALGYDLYVQANGKSQRAHYKSDIYVCKNFTTYLFRENRDDFCMAEFPDVQLKVPDNLSEKKSRPYSYGIEWEDVAAEDGNPFYIAAQFKYDKSLGEEENMALACEFMRQAQRGDYFQMSAKYEYGTGAHSAIMLGYDAETDEIHWMDSNMRGGKKNGIRYGLVQYDEVKSVTWWASTFCQKTRGATLYRLREDIEYRPGHEPEAEDGN